MWLRERRRAAAAQSRRWLQSDCSPPTCAGLHRLDLSGNPVCRLPQTLAAATKLFCLQLDRLPSLALCDADVDLLAGLPSLRLLRLTASGPTPPAVIDRLRAACPNLKIYLH